MVLRLKTRKILASLVVRRAEVVLPHYAIIKLLYLKFAVIFLFTLIFIYLSAFTQQAYSNFEKDHHRH